MDPTLEFFLTHIHNVEEKLTQVFPSQFQSLKHSNLQFLSALSDYSDSLVHELNSIILVTSEMEKNWFDSMVRFNVDFMGQVDSVLSNSVHEPKQVYSLDEKDTGWPMLIRPRFLQVSTSPICFDEFKIPIHVFSKICLSIQSQLFSFPLSGKPSPSKV